MAYRKLVFIERERGSLHTVIPELLAKHNGNQQKVAEELGVSVATISRWIGQNHYVRVVRWERAKDE